MPIIMGSGEEETLHASFCDTSSLQYCAGTFPVNFLHCRQAVVLPRRPAIFTWQDFTRKGPICSADALVPPPGYQASCGGACQLGAIAVNSSQITINTAQKLNCGIK